jgi:hypothetical protein
MNLAGITLAIGHYRLFVPKGRRICSPPREWREMVAIQESVP